MERFSGTGIFLVFLVFLGTGCQNSNETVNDQPNILILFVDGGQGKGVFKQIIQGFSRYFCGQTSDNRYFKFELHET